MAKKEHRSEWLAGFYAVIYDLRSHTIHNLVHKIFSRLLKPLYVFCGGIKFDIQPDFDRHVRVCRMGICDAPTKCHLLDHWLPLDTNLSEFTPNDISQELHHIRLSIVNSLDPLPIVFGTEQRGYPSRIS